MIQNNTRFKVTTDGCLTLNKLQIVHDDSSFSRVHCELLRWTTNQLAAHHHLKQDRDSSEKKTSSSLLWRSAGCYDRCCYGGVGFMLVVGGSVSSGWSLTGNPPSWTARARCLGTRRNRRRCVELSLFHTPTAPYTPTGSDARRGTPGWLRPETHDITHDITHWGNTPETHFSNHTTETRGSSELKEEFRFNMFEKQNFWWCHCDVTHLELV